MNQLFKKIAQNLFDCRHSELARLPENSMIHIEATFDSLLKQKAENSKQNKNTFEAAV